jgi:hypothetical protein
MPSPSELLTEQGRLGAGKGGLGAARRIEDRADARDAMELMRFHDDRIARGGGGAGSWR